MMEESSCEVQRNRGRRRTVKMLVLQLSPFLILMLLLLTFVYLRPSKPQRVSVTTYSLVAQSSACIRTLHPALCLSMSSHVLHHNQSSPCSHTTHLLHTALSQSIPQVSQLLDVALNLSSQPVAPPEGHLIQATLMDCVHLFDETLVRLNKILQAFHDIDHCNISISFTAKSDMQNLISSSITLMDTCSAGLGDLGTGFISLLEASIIRSHIMFANRFLSIALAMAAEVNRDYSHGNLPPKGVNGTAAASPVSSWLPLLATLQNPTARLRLEQVADVVVAKDGKSNFSTISQAIDASPFHNNRRYVIYVKAGIYEENVVVPKKKTNIMVIGDGMDRTVVTANRSFKDGFTTLNSATFAVVGRGFIARDITFENTAGPEKGQAVALRVASDRSAFFRCKIKGFQDTLYAHYERQFYRECHIYGTVDFIFGNAAAVFEKCILFARKPLEGQMVTVTAQGRSDPNQKTGMSFVQCIVTADPDLLSEERHSFNTYLGRPWRNFSRTVYMHSFLDDIVHPEGWLQWRSSHTDWTSTATLYYAEFMNSGPGSAIKYRVNWPGYHLISNRTEALQFTAKEFISGSEWLPSTSVNFFGGA